ncbi:PQQ-binding-like beta-propeller repeat protein [Haloferacaceae archaeon DSL9]
MRAEDSVAGSVALDRQHAYFGSWDRRVYAVEKDTGEETWRFDADGHVGSADGNVCAVETETGTQRWPYETGGIVLRASPVIDDETLYIGAGGRSGSGLHAVAVDSGEGEWFFETADTVHNSATLGDETLCFAVSR